MRFGINSFLFVSPFTTDSVKLFKKFKAWGFDTVEIPVEAPEHIAPAALKAAAEKAGIAIGSVCACMGPGRDLRGTVAEQETAIAYISTLIGQAAEMGCPRIIGPLYSVVGKRGPVPAARKKTEFATVVKNLKVLAALAAKKGIELDVEPLNRFETDFLNTCEQGLKLLKAVGAKNVKLHLDTFHMNIEEKNQAAAIRKVGRHLGHFHACGTDRGTPGGDSLDWAPIVSALHDIGYGGDVVIESFTQDVKVIAAAAAIWRKIEPRQNDIAVKGLANMIRLFGPSARNSATANSDLSVRVKNQTKPTKTAKAMSVKSTKTATAKTATKPAKAAAKSVKVAAKSVKAAAKPVKAAAKPAKAAAKPVKAAAKPAKAALKPVKAAAKPAKAALKPVKAAAKPAKAALKPVKAAAKPAKAAAKPAKAALKPVKAAAKPAKAALKSAKASAPAKKAVSKK
jgi:D-psicose/D-tagatose/L-ribulose 3-epimerase